MALSRVQNDSPRVGSADSPSRRTASTTGQSQTFQAILGAMQQQALLGSGDGDGGGVSATQFASLIASAGRVDPQLALAIALASTQESGNGFPLPLPTRGGVSTFVAPTAASRAYAAADSKQARFAALKPHFVESERTTGVPWQVQAAQWALESGWGAATPKDVNTGQESYNLFGVKGVGPAGSVLAQTQEYEDGAYVDQVARFRAYHSFQESIAEHAQLLKTPYYAPARAAGQDLKGWTEQLGPQNLGYATDPDYSRKLWQIMQENGWA